VRLPRNTADLRFVGARADHSASLPGTGIAATVLLVLVFVVVAIALSVSIV
jgi:hypothetical protein